ncbi:hypothetical protein B0H14DRAFT_2592230 [Mycena olivaceomarginata]|nr:hypothetical protein B0H14DRAFT_2592230 [Mycena olivaceomarginata]
MIQRLGSEEPKAGVEKASDRHPRFYKEGKKANVLDLGLIPKVHPNAYLAPLGALKKLDYDWNVVYVAIAHSDFKPQGRVPQSRFAPLAAHMRQDHHMGHFCHREYLREDFEWKDLEEAGVPRW